MMTDESLVPREGKVVSGVGKDGADVLCPIDERESSVSAVLSDKYSDMRAGDGGKLRIMKSLRLAARTRSGTRKFD